MRYKVWILGSPFADIRRLHAVESSAHAALGQPMLIFNRDAAPTLCRCAEASVRIVLRSGVSDNQHLELAATLGKVRASLESRFWRVRRFVDDDHHPFGVDTLDVGHSLRRIAFRNSNRRYRVSVVTFDSLQGHLRIDHVTWEPARLTDQILKIGPHTLADHLCGRRGQDDG